MVKGRTLAELLRERSSPTENLPRFLQVFEQVCQAMGVASGGWDKTIRIWKAPRLEAASANTASLWRPNRKIAPAGRSSTACGDIRALGGGGDRCQYRRYPPPLGFVPPRQGSSQALARRGFSQRVPGRGERVRSADETRLTRLFRLSGPCPMKLARALSASKQRSTRSGWQTVRARRQQSQAGNLGKVGTYWKLARDVRETRGRAPLAAWRSGPFPWRPP